MADERKNSTEEGIAPPPESPKGKAAERENRKDLIQTPEDARPESGMGGTSDADSPGDEAWTPRPDLRGA
jgi:hypothetical protein